MKILVFVFLLFVAFAVCKGTTVRPLYIAGFMANSIYDVDSYIAAGANVVQADLMFDQFSGHATEFHKGFPCDCFRLCHKRENVINYLGHIKEITTPGHPKFKPNFTGILLIEALLHMTTETRSAGKDFASVLARYLFNNENRAKIVIDTLETKHWPFIEAMVENLKERGREDLLQRIGIAATTGINREILQKATNVSMGLWMGDGVTNCREDFFSVRNVREACKIRDQGLGVSKVIRWTTDYRKNIRNALWLGVDVIGTNDVHDVRAVMREDEFKERYRLATSDDDPFARVKGTGANRYGCRKASIFHHSYICWKDAYEGESWCNVNKDCTETKSDCEAAVRLPCM